MKRMNLDLGPRDESEAAVAAAENFRLDVQYALIDAMEGRGMSQQDLALKLGVTEARVSQYFSDQCNITVRVLGRILHAIGARCSFTLSPAAATVWERVEPDRASEFDAALAQAISAYKAGAPEYESKRCSEDTKLDEKWSPSRAA